MRLTYRQGGNALTTNWNVSSKADLRTWANNSFDVDDEQAQRLADYIWEREDFPHPVNNTDITDYLADLPDEWVYAVIDNQIDDETYERVQQALEEEQQ